MKANHTILRVGSALLTDTKTPRKPPTVLDSEPTAHLQKVDCPTRLDIDGSISALLMPRSRLCTLGEQSSSRNSQFRSISDVSMATCSLLSDSGVIHLKVLAVLEWPHYDSYR